MSRKSLKPQRDSSMRKARLEAADESSDSALPQRIALAWARSL